MIIDYSVEYAEEILQLIENYPMEWGESGPTVLALTQGKVVGVGSLSTNDLHTYREYVNIFVHPQKREMGTGRALFNRLLSKSKPKKFQVAISSKNKVAVSFLNQCGFKLVRKCYTPILENNHPVVCEHYPTMQEQDVAVQNEVFALQWDNYRTFHKVINPLSERVSFHKWKELIFEDLSWEHSYVLRREGKVAAYVLCYVGETAGQIEIGYVGGRDVGALEDYRWFYKQVTNQLIQDFGMVEIEADDVDPYASALLNQYAYDQSDSWDTYILG